MKLGFAMCGSFCTHADALGVLRALARDHEIVPIVSECVAGTDTRFGTAEELRAELVRLCGREPVASVREAEPLGPREPLDALLICPCTGNTLAKLAHGITDGPVTMAAKAHLRADRPLVIALASNDALSANLANIGNLLNRKNIYFVPLRQDAPREKPHSLVADFSLVLPAIDAARERRQIRPLFLCR